MLELFYGKIQELSVGALGEKLDLVDLFIQKEIFDESEDIFEFPEKLDQFLKDNNLNNKKVNF